MSHVTAKLAEFVSKTTFEDLPADVVHETKRILLDIIGCALESVTLDKGRIAVEFASEAGDRPEAAILGTASRVSPPMAAFANGELMHALEYCSLLPPNHISALVTPAPMALAEATNASGKRLITAVAVAHEVASRVGLSLDSLRGKKDGEVAPAWGLGFDLFGATAGAGKILGLEASAMTDAIGLDGYLAPVPSHNRFLLTPQGGGLAKYGPAGCTAQGGLAAALLARKGYHGDRSILDSEFGFATMAGSEGFQPEKITTGLGQAWNVLRVTYKCWPCCGVFQSPLRAFTRLVAEHDLAPEEIESVVISNEQHGTLPRFRHTAVDHHVDAQTNLAYNIAMVAHRVEPSAAWQYERNLNDPGVRAFMRKGTVEPYARAHETRHQELVVEGKPYIERRPCCVRVRARGRLFTQTAKYAKWLSTDNGEFRATDEDLVRKFRANAVEVLGGRKLDDAIERIMTLDRLDNPAHLVAALTP